MKIEGHDALNVTTITLDNVQVDNIKPFDLTQQYTAYTLGPGAVNFAAMLSRNRRDRGQQRHGSPEPVYEGATSLATAQLNGAAVLPLSVAGLSVGAHTLTATYSGDANYAPLAFGSYTVTVASSGPAPAIAAGGVVNGASFRAAPGIAPGSLFSVFGTNLGPAQGTQAAGYPLSSSLAGTSVQIAAAGARFDAWMVYASAGQVNAVLPSAVTPGAAQVTVTVNGEASPPAAVTIIPSAPGIFFSRVAGVDNVYFTVPAGVPFGCQVPVAVTAAGVAANTVNIAITADGAACR